MNNEVSSLAGNCSRTGDCLAHVAAEHETGWDIIYKQQNDPDSGHARVSKYDKDCGLEQKVHESYNEQQLRFGGECKQDTWGEVSQGGRK
jgi:hypothetical protein